MKELKDLQNLLMQNKTTGFFWVQLMIFIDEG
jgi:hypothetical protein